VFGRLATRKWERPALRRYYVSSLCQLLPEVVLAGDTVGADAILSCEQAFTFRHCVRVLETLTGRIAPVQFHPFETDIAIEVAQAVAKDWAKWHAEVGTPQRKQP
jgi:hypothetical protein